MIDELVGSLVQLNVLTVKNGQLNFTIRYANNLQHFGQTTSPMEAGKLKGVTIKRTVGEFEFGKVNIRNNFKKMLLLS